jgi:hypothetical protein
MRRKNIIEVGLSELAFFRKNDGVIVEYWWNNFLKNTEEKGR